MRIFLRDRNVNLVDAWRPASAKAPPSRMRELSIDVGDPTEAGAVALVSPANAFGFMDGGIDLAYCKRFGPDLEKEVRNQIHIRCRFGELLVGQAEAVGIPGAEGATRILIVAPTMRVPMRIADPVDIYLATRAAVRCALDHELSSLAMPGMGTGCGEVPTAIAAKAMITGIVHAYHARPMASKTVHDASQKHWDFQTANP